MSQAQSHLLLPADSAWLSLERPDNPMTITVMLRVDGLTAPRFREFLKVYWIAWERFVHRPVQRGPGWWWQRDPEFDVRRHLDVVIERFSEAGLQEWVSARLNEPLPLFRPRWKFWLAPNAPGGAALVLRMHHCYADGLSLLGVFDQLCPASPRQHPALYGAPEQGEFSRWSSAAQAWLEQLAPGQQDRESGADESRSATASLEYAEQVLEQHAQKGLRLLSEVTDFLVEPEDSPSGFRRPLLGRRHCRWSAPVPLERFRCIAETTNVTINDVLLSCVTAAARPRLGLSDDELERAVIHAAVPVDIRGRLPEELKPPSGTLGNYFGTVFVALPVDGESPLERLYRIKQETRRLKKSWQPGIAWGLASTASVIPDPLRQPIADVFYRKASVVVSNVPGKQEPRYLAGCRITEQMFWVPQAGDIGVGISIASYAGRVQFGVVADESVMSDPSAFLDDCLQELDRFPGGS
ncbi:WS/DGAT domain-containing protein [Marinobacter sp.]|uniref:WS/DGAT domain-containing protein n=1 Tax=Marinobacter sp. TaxID=50741 RepID=UPI00397635D4